jgi:DNA-binding transcriptional regulator YhcF (GntR family)
MPFVIEHSSGVSLYVQLMTQFRAQVESGELIVGTKLPTVRKLAADLKVAPYTVARVYRALEADGFVETLGRNGTVVLGTGDTAAELLQRAASAYAERASDLGIEADAARDYIRAAFTQRG